MSTQLESLIKDLELNHEYCPKNVILAAAAELRRLHAENEALRADAERYRWLRLEKLFPDLAVCTNLDAIDVGSSGVAGTYEDTICEDRLDAAIDAARGGK